MLRPPEERFLACDAPDAAARQERALWPIHAKMIGRIDFDKLALLDCSESVMEHWLHELGWLLDDTRYAAVPIAGAVGVPSARYKARWMRKLLDCGVIERIDSDQVRGHVHMFVVPEERKERFRSIKHTASINFHCGRESLTKCAFPGKAEVADSVHDGSCFIALDFAAYYDQFPLGEAVSTRMCFRQDKDFYRLRTLAMGQRQAVEVANAATALLLDFPRRSASTLSIIDNVKFTGSKDAVVHDAWIFIQRCKTVNATLNEIDVTTATREQVECLVRHAGEWAGIYHDLASKTVRLTDKLVEKATASWSHRARWTWREYAGHVGLLFWAWNIIDVPVAEFFDVLRFNSELGQYMTTQQLPQRPDGTCPKNEAWDRPAQIYDSVWPLIKSWTELLLRNAPRAVRRRQPPQLLMECDTSGIGYGYVSLNETSGELFSWGAPWTEGDRKVHGEKLGKSVYSEPLGLRRCVMHALLRNATVSNIAVGTDNTVTRAAFTRGFNSHSFHINRCVQLFARDFPRSTYDFSFTYVPGAEILGDAPSRGRIDCKHNRDEKVDMLRRHLGPTTTQVRKSVVMRPQRATVERS